MEFNPLDFILHLDVYLDMLVDNYGTWIYAILFLVIFCETGLVIMPFLPGDSLLFIAGAIYLALAKDDDTKVLGFCQLYPSFSSLSLKRVWILNDIYVAEDSRRQLVADHLMKHAKQMAKETHAVRMRVSTSSDNEVAHKVYESIGFKEDTQFKNYVLPIN